ncbi:MAG: hypothetical protein H0V26_01730 [Solirubrobacterales bacterium]|nr:hypothetical protein [Solirubrobacterales bacterium]
MRDALARPVAIAAVEGIPACGTNDEVLRHHGLDVDGIVARLEALAG